MFFFCAQRAIIAAHKICLAEYSEEFKKMFEAEALEFPIDASFQGLIEFRQFFYTDNVKLSLEFIFEVMELAAKYGNGEIKKKCDHFLAMNLKISNVIKAYETAVKCAYQTLPTVCLNKIAQEAKELVNSQLLNGVAQDTLAIILDLDNLRCQESVLLRAVIQ